MRSVEENIQALTHAVFNEAHAEAEQILSDAQAKAEAIRQDAQQQASVESAKILAEASQQANQIRSQTKAAAQLQANTTALERREKLLNSVFAAVQKQLSDIPQRADYGQITRRLLREALLHLESDTAQVRADELTQAHLTEQVFAELSAELGIKVLPGPPLEQGAGLIAQTADGHRQYDNTLEARLSRQQNTLRAPILHILMGETL